MDYKKFLENIGKPYNKKSLHGVENVKRKTSCSDEEKKKALEYLIKVSNNLNKKGVKNGK